MKITALIFIGSALTLHAVTNTNTVVTVRMATEPYVTNRIGAAVAIITTNTAAQISAATATLASAASVAALSNAVASLPPAPSGVPYWIGSNVFATLEQDGRGYVWGITNSSQLMVTLRYDFVPEEYQSPSWTIHEFPFSESWGVGGTRESGALFIEDSVWSVWETAELPVVFPATLYPVSHAFGQATVYRPLATNIITRLAITNDLPAAIAAWQASDAAYEWLADQAGGIAYGIIANHAGDPAAHVSALDARYAPLIPATAIYTNATGATTITNGNAQRVKLYGTGVVSLAFSGLNQLDSLRLVISGPDSVAWPTNAYSVGGYSYQTNRANHYIVEPAGSELLVYPITTTAD